MQYSCRTIPAVKQTLRLYVVLLATISSFAGHLTAQSRDRRATESAKILDYIDKG